LAQFVERPSVQEVVEHQVTLNCRR
jgi:hypothetical protein